MDLIVFDLDGTLLNRSSEISDYTRDTLQRLSERGIAYTVATGRALHSARSLLDDHGFILPHIYKNGVMIWQPEDDAYSHSNLLTHEEIATVYGAFTQHGITPFVFTIEPGNRHAIYHPPLQTETERRLSKDFGYRNEVEVLPIAELPAEADIANISAIGPAVAIRAVEQQVMDAPHLVAYAGTALEGDHLDWIDIHHIDASKGNAVRRLREELGVQRVICFGDSDNDLSMFEEADESYAPSNAKDPVKQAATAVIGHHDEDGIARFLRERFEL